MQSVARPPLHRELLDLLASISFAEGEALVRGTPATDAIFSAWSRQPLGDRDRRGDRVEDLAAALYQRCYLRPTGLLEEAVFDPDRDGLFRLELLRAAADEWVWEHGWHVVDPADQRQVVVQKRTLRCWVDRTMVRAGSEATAEGRLL